MAKKAILAEKGQFWPFWPKNPIFGVFSRFWAPGGSPGPRFRGGFTSTPRPGRPGRAPRGPWRGPGGSQKGVPGPGGPGSPSGDSRRPRTPGPGRGFYINPSRRGPAVPGRVPREVPEGSPEPQTALPGPGRKRAKIALFWPSRGYPLRTPKKVPRGGVGIRAAQARGTLRRRGRGSPPGRERSVGPAARGPSCRGSLSVKHR